MIAPCLVNKDMKHTRIDSFAAIVLLSGCVLQKLGGQDADFYVNVAYGKPANQSTTYLGNPHFREPDNFFYNASLAVDGNIATNFHNNSCSHTNMNQTNVWWEVDLQGLYEVSNIKIYQRSDDNQDGLKGFVVKGKQNDGNYFTFENSSSYHTGEINISLQPKQQFKAIRIQLDKIKAFICLCEVQVFAVNVARGKQAFQSSTYQGDHGLYNASLAVDGNIDTNFADNSCSSTNNGQSEWWKVELEGQYALTVITIYQRSNGNTDWLSGYKLLGRRSNGIYDSIKTPNYMTGVIQISVSPVKAYDEIMIQLNGTDKGICLCEVQIFSTIMCPMKPAIPMYSTYVHEPGIEGNGLYNSTVTITCIRGYKLSGLPSVRCIDYDQWNGVLGMCLPITCNISKLNQTMGIYSCTQGVAGSCPYNSTLTVHCNTGHKLTGYNSSQCIGTDNWSRSIGICDDIDECNTVGTSCNNQGLCSNTDGGFTCRCDTGYTGYRCEIDIDECTTMTTCHNHGQCSNTDGGFSCRCDTGYTGTSCESDIDECATMGTACHNHGVCSNTDGGFLCRCGTGYTGHHCESDIDECTTITTTCHNHGECSNTDGGFSCLCDTGYTGTSCESVIQCSGRFILPNNSVHLYEEGIEGNLTYNSTISIRCKEGYKVYGTDLIRCNELGDWDRQFGTCRVIDCGCPEDVPHDVQVLIMSGIAGGFSYNATACIQSNEELKRVGNIYESLRCSSDGSWRGNLGKCFETTKKEAYMDQDGQKITLPIAILLPICLILIVTNFVTLLKHRRYACYREQPSNQHQVDMTIADHFDSNQNGNREGEQTRLSHSNGDTELEMIKSGSEETHSHSTGPYDELRKDNRETSEYDELKFKRD